MSKKTVRRHKPLPEYTTLGCPLTRNRSNWCFRECVPQEGHGTCGRDAPHAMLDKRQQAILKYKQEHPEESKDA